MDDIVPQTQWGCERKDETKSRPQAGRGMAVTSEALLAQVLEWRIPAIAAQAETQARSWCFQVPRASRFLEAASGLAAYLRD